MVDMLGKSPKYGYNMYMSTSTPSKSIEILKTKPISKRGGARVGAGRKPKLQFEARELFNISVDKNWDMLMEKVWEAVKNGDKDMLKFVIEQKIGKPAQAINVHKREVQVHHNLFYKPKVMEAVKVFEDQIKGELIRSFEVKGGKKEDVDLT